MDGCIFCKIATGEIASNIVYDGELVMGFRDVNPQAPHHYLLIPKKHIANITDMGEDDLPLLAEMFRAVNSIVEAKGMKDRGFRTVLNQGRMAGQTVDHLHLHILGGRVMGWPPG